MTDISLVDVPLQVVPPYTQGIQFFFFETSEVKPSSFAVFSPALEYHPSDFLFVEVFAVTPLGTKHIVQRLAEQTRRKTAQA